MRPRRASPRCSLREWKPKVTNYQSGALWKYAQLVGPAHLGALTHPGAAEETHVYADL